MTFCQKCGVWDSRHSTQYEPAKQYQHNGPTSPECLRHTCGHCGYSYTTPCADARGTQTPEPE